MPDPANSRIIVTGGSGIAGRHILSTLLDLGYTSIMNLDQNPIPDPHLASRVWTMKCDLTNAGEVFSALSSSYLAQGQPLSSTYPPLPPPPTAVIHLAAVPRNMILTDNATFHNNVSSTYNICEAASKLGCKKIVLASSVCAYGITYAHGDVPFDHFPLDEDDDRKYPPPNPMDPYSMGKVAAENIGRGFARKFGIDVYALRIGAVIEPDKIRELFLGYLEEPQNWKSHVWSYIDARDLGRMVGLCIEKHGLGFQVFNATNDTITNDEKESTMEFLKEVCAGQGKEIEFSREMGKREAPLSNRKIKEMLGFKEMYPWRTEPSYREALGR